MTLRTIICRAAALIPAIFVCLVTLKAPVAAESAVKQRGEATFEASWYPRSAAFGGQKNSFFMSRYNLNYQFLTIPLNGS